MKRTLTRLTVLLALLLPAEWAWSSGVPIVLTHTVTDFRAGIATAGFDVQLRVANHGVLSLSDLTLSLVPMPPFFKGCKTLVAGSLTPQQSATIHLHLEASPNHGRHEVAGRVLHFTGKYRDADGTVQEFTVTSHPEGAK